MRLTAEVGYPGTRAVIPLVLDVDPFGRSKGGRRWLTHELQHSLWCPRAVAGDGRLVAEAV